MTVWVSRSTRATPKLRPQCSELVFKPGGCGEATEGAFLFFSPCSPSFPCRRLLFAFELQLLTRLPVILLLNVCLPETVLFACSEKFA